MSLTAASILDQAAVIALSVDRRTSPVAAHRLPLLVQGTRLKLGVSDDGSMLAALDVNFRFSLLLHIADGEITAAPIVKDVVAATVKELARSHEKVTGLALWAGLSREESGFDALPEPYRAIAIERAVRGGMPVGLDAAIAYVEEMLPPGPERDHGFVAIFQSRCPVGEAVSATDWLPLLGRVEGTLARAQGLLELATQRTSIDHGDELVPMASAAYQLLSPQDALWRGRPAAMLAGVLGPSEAVRAAKLLNIAWVSLAAVSDLTQRTQAHQTLLMAQSQLGLAAWRRALDGLKGDLPLKADPKRWANLVFDAAGLARFLRGTDEERFTALAVVRDQIVRITHPIVKTEAFAAFAEASSRVSGPTTAAAFAEVEAVLTLTQDPRARAVAIPRVSRLCGQADLAGALEMVRLGRSAHEKVMWLLPLAEIAAGLRR